MPPLPIYRSKIAFCAAAALVGTLAVLPSSGWLVRREADYLALPVTDQKRIPKREKREAVQHRERFDFALADALQSSGSSDTPTDGIKSNTVRALLWLRNRFDDQPALHADILRFLTSGDLTLGRNEENILLSPKRLADQAKENTSPPPPRRSSPEAIVLALQSAERGEALAPRNAVFPFMASIALLADHRDSEAIAALRRAADKPDWNEYLPDEVAARDALSRSANGETGGTARASIAASILFPQYAVMRDYARVATALAVEREQAGDTEGGFAIRQAAAQIGAKMRVQSSSVIGSLVGMAITSISGSRPGGSAVLPDDIRSEARTAAHRARYVSYLTSTGHADEAAWFVAEITDGEKVKAITHAGVDQSIFSVGEMARLAAGWGSGLLLLLNCLWVLLLGGGAALLSRTRRIREGLPLHRGIRAGLAATAALGIGGGLLVAAGSDGLFPFDTLGAGAAFCGLIAAPLCIVWLKKGESWRGFGRNVAVCAATVGVAAGLIGLMGLSASGVPGLYSALVAFSGMSGDSPGSETALWCGFGMLGGTALVLAFFLPILLVVFAVRGRKIFPASVAMVRGLRQNALGVSAALLLLYAVSVGVTLKAEATFQTEMAVSVRHEGRYFASLTGQEWPGENVIPANPRPH